jgi:hypothetical protein
VVKIKDPWIVNNFFNEKEYSKIMNSINKIEKSKWIYEGFFDRYVYSSELLHRISWVKLNYAREQFESETLLPTYSLLALYNKNSSRLEKHKDTNACTYTFDICLYSESVWPLVVEGKEYILNKNNALCFYGEDQEHWRPEIAPKNKVLMLFMHYAEPEHIYFQDWDLR